ncbi:MAG TPA: hypothetical protein VFB67_01300 [Candidatus Polarisedimenticolaceae bacterium]|nr:hypothetical protein [Candidatus Polarisedimenticolaceae bacterium]
MRLVTALSLALLLAAPAAAAELVDVSATVFSPTANPGGTNEGTCTVSNSTSGDVRVRLEARVVFADGKVSRLSKIQDPGTLPPGGGFELSVLFLVPSDAALGTAQFVCDVDAQSLVTRSQHEHETQSATFEVVP